jgi:hypothetical protein
MRANASDASADNAASRDRLATSNALVAAAQMGAALGQRLLHEREDAIDDGL